MRSTPEDIEELERVSQQSWSFRESANVHEEMVKNNTQFHLCIARAAHNRELLHLVTGLLERTERLSYLELRTSHLSAADIRSLHKPILEAIQRKDPAAAREAIAEDIARGQMDILGARDWTLDHKWLDSAVKRTPAERPRIPNDRRGRVRGVQTKE